MAMVYFLGGAAKTPYVNSSAVTGTPTPSGAAVATVNGKTVTYTIAPSGDTAASVVAGLLAALRATTVPGEFKQFTYDSPAVGTLRATGPADGAPVSIAFTVAGATVTATTATNSSPHDLTNVVNWGGALPTNSDTAVFDRDVAAKYNADGFAAISCAVLRTANHKSDIGLPDYNPLGFAEYRPTKLDCLGTSYALVDNGQGVVRIKAHGTISPTVNVTGTAANQTGRDPGVYLYGTGATWTITVNGGGVAVYEGTLIASLTAAKASVRCPFLLPATTVTLSATYGTLALTVATAATLDAESDVTFLAGSSFGTGATLGITGSVGRWNSSGGLRTVALGPKGAFDASGAPTTFAVATKFTAAGGSRITDPYRRVTKPFTVELDECAPGDVTLDLGPNPVLTVS